MSEKLSALNHPQKNPGRFKHSAKWDRCVRDVKARGGVRDPYAICSASVKSPARKKNRRTLPGGGWVVTAIKKRGGARYYYAGGARLATERKEAIVFPSVIHAETVKHSILSDFPTKLTGAYLWQALPAT